MKRGTIITAISYFFILLFLYTALSKIMAFSVTLFDMRRNPLLSEYPLFWTIAVPAVEIIICALLLFPQKRRVGLWATMALMISFTGYVGILLASNYDLPCTCGGIFRELSWRQHLWVNIGLVLLATVALLLDSRKVTQKYIYE